MLQIASNFKKSFDLTPLPIFFLIIYMGLRSTQIFPDYFPVRPMWHLAYAGWYDFFLLGSIVVTYIFSPIKLDNQSFEFFLMLMAIALLSFLHGGIELGVEYIRDTIIFLLRFFLTFSFAKVLVRHLGCQTVESVLYIIFILLAISSLFAFSLQFGTNNRIFAAAMTAPSFSQVATIVGLISILRRSKITLIISLIFMLLTFSRTSMLLMLVLFLVYSFRNQPIWKTLLYVAAIVVIVVIGTSLLLYFAEDQFGYVLASRTSMDEISTLNSRDEIWRHAFALLDRGNIPLFGIGVNGTPSLLHKTNFYYYPDPLSETGEGIIPHFHSIIIEYIFGFGISSIILFYYILQRSWKTLKNNCYPAFFIFAFFIICQSVDFTFYNPKETIVWSFMLGMAEGQFKLEKVDK